MLILIINYFLREAMLKKINFANYEVCEVQSFLHYLYKRL